MESKLIINTILTENKNISDILYRGVTESTTPIIYKAFRTILGDSLKLQNEIINFMKEKGWYFTNSVDKEKVKTIKGKFHY